jgi:D-3-phosphoglycerate dehydrogenase
VQVDAELISAGARLIVIGRAGVGVDNVDLDAATRAGITVVNAPTGNTSRPPSTRSPCSTASPADRRCRREPAPRRVEAQRVHRPRTAGRTLGIIGLGKIGQAIAVRARATEMTVLGSDPYVTAEQAANHGVELVEFWSCWSAPTSSPSTSR